MWILSRMIYPDLTLITLSRMSNDKEGAYTQEIWAASTQKKEFDTSSLCHGLCGSVGSHPFTIMTLYKTHSLLALTIKI
jgi:hypothetical protein